jgi:peptidoglycan/LPS O-acetylase OafA/YrhL
MLSCSPLVHVGKVSYGLYLWNLLPGQTFRLLEGRHPGILGTVGCALVMVVVVEVSYWYVERPLLRWAKRRLERAGQRRPDRVAGATTVPATR